MWVPGHCGIGSNEAADVLIRVRANLLCHGPKSYLGIIRKQKISAQVGWVKNEQEVEKHSWLQTDQANDSRCLVQSWYETG